METSGFLLEIEIKAFSAELIIVRRGWPTRQFLLMHDSNLSRHPLGPIQYD